MNATTTRACEETPEEKARRLGVPLIPKVIPIIPSPIDHNRVISVCGECGLELRLIMGYVCTHGNCPTGLGGVTC